MTEEANVVKSERRQTRDVLITHFKTIGFQIIDSLVHVERVPEHNHIDDQAQCAELVLLPLLVLLAHFPLLSMKDRPRQSMTLFAAQQLNEDAAAVGGIVNVAEEVKSL
jgi:hypothetical protein